MKSKVAVGGLSLITVMVMALCACGDTVSQTSEVTTAESELEAVDNSEDDEMSQLANPFVDYESLEEAEAATGFELQVPDAPEGYDTVLYRVMNSSMIEVIWMSSDDEDAVEAYRIRKEAGDGDISGDYNEYSEVSTVESDGRTVTMKGSDGKVFVMTWTDDGYTYAMDIDMNGEGLSQEAAMELAANVR